MIAVNTFLKTLTLLFLAFGPQNAVFSDEKDTGVDWNQWRGPNRDGVVAGKPWPQDWELNRLWPLWVLWLGSSYSGPVMFQSTIYVTESSGNN